MRYNSKITYKDNELTGTCQKVLNTAARKIMKITIKWMEDENRKLKNTIMIERNGLNQTEGHARAKNMETELQVKINRTGKKLMETKNKKLQGLKCEQEENRTTNDQHIRLPSKRTRCRNNRRRIKKKAKQKRTKREKKLKQKEEDLINKLQGIQLPSSDRFVPFDNTNYDMPQNERDLCAKGLKFVPSTVRVDVNKKQQDFDDFSRKLRLAVFFRNNPPDENSTYEKQPWDPKSTWNPPTKESPELEEYLKVVHDELFNPKNRVKVMDNLTSDQRTALKTLSNWNRDENNPRMFRIQDKGARFVIDRKERYREHVESFLEDQTTFKEDNEDKSSENENIVKKWAQGWEVRDEKKSKVPGF
jgi:hypothetical protein